MECAAAAAVFRGDGARGSWSDVVSGSLVCTDAPVADRLLHSPAPLDTTTGGAGFDGWLGSVSGLSVHVFKPIYTFDAF